MLIELVVRFVIGGLVVSAFAVIGDALRPKNFAGIFGAAPSVALATLGLTFVTKGATVSGIEGRSMVAGATAFLFYSLVSSWLLRSRMASALAVASASCVIWFAVAFGLWGVFLR